MELNILLKKIDDLDAEITKLRPIDSTIERRILDKFRLDWNYNSNAIEGNKLTLGETKAFLLEGLTASGKPLKDHLDIRGHDDVVTFLAGFVQRKEILTEAIIRELHKILLHEPYKVQAKTRDGGITSKLVKLGEYKTEPNFVVTPSGTIKEFSLPQDTPAGMHSLMEWFRKTTTDKDLHPIIFASIFHNKFTQIHPFDDGNGRMARILLNLILMQNNLLPVVIKLQNRDAYIAALTKADVGEENDLIALVAEAEVYSQELFLKGARGEDVSDYEDVDKRIALLKMELQHIEKPAEISISVQKDFMSRLVIPLTTRLAKRMSQFDELFASHSVQLTGQYVQFEHGIVAAWETQLSESVENNIKEISRVIDAKHLFNFLNIVFRWNGFQRAGLNTFDYSFHVQVTFSKYQYLISATLLHGQIVFQHTNLYQLPPTEDQIRSLLTALAEKVLGYIQHQIHINKQ
jgi:Fic family protein